jgi:serine/threonine-protein kinase
LTPVPRRVYIERVKIGRLLRGVIVTAGLFFAGVIVFNYVIMPRLVHQRGSVIVPDLRNTSEKEAAQTLSRLGLVLRVARTEHDPQVPAGFVVSQRPPANESLKPGRSVEVVVSLGTRSHPVPEVRGMTSRQSRSVLEHAGLSVGRVAKVLHAGSDRERVVATSPAVGDEVSEGKAVDLVVSAPGAARTFLMPDLSAGDLFVARERLERQGFRVASVRYEARPGVFPNTIIGQRPRPGARIREGESVELVASSSR